MIKTVQTKIKSNPRYLEYLHTHSYWYKDLNRDPNNFKRFEEDARKNLKLRPTDKIEKTLDMIDMLQTILGSING